MTSQVDLEQLKRDKLADIVRRVIANPQNLTETVTEISLDWFPMMRAVADGKFEIIIGHGKKK